MNMKKIYIRPLMALLFLILELFALFLPVEAREAHQLQVSMLTQEAHQLEVHTETAEGNVAGVSYQIYQVGVYQKGDLWLQSPYDSDLNQANLKEATEKAWESLAANLFSVVKKEKTSPDFTCVSDADGLAKLKISKEGLYLLVGDTFTKGENVYTPVPFLLAVGQSSQKQIQVSGKYKMRPAKEEKIKKKVENTPNKGERKLPQTGQLQWPIPVLYLAGLLLICSQIRRKSFLKGVGVLLLAGALTLQIGNLWQSMWASQRAEEISRKLEERMEDQDSGDEDSEKNAEGSSGEEEGLPFMELDGVAYIGRLYIPSLDVTIPVTREWNYSNLREGACRYFGTTQEDNLVIAAHNYDYFFGRIKNLKAEDKIYFQDMENQVTEYQVLGQEILDPYQVEEMTSGESDLTLFTCTPGGASRVTVRCGKTGEENLTAVR